MSYMSTVRKYLISGILVWLPIWVILLIVHFLVSTLDAIFELLPAAYQPDNLLSFHIPGLGVLFTLIILFFTGMIVTNILGQRLVAFWDNLMARIPIVRPIHAGVRKILETIFHPKGKAFRKVLLIEYPRKGLWSIAFQTGKGNEEIADKVGLKMITIFVPTTPNPTSGFLLMVPKKDVHELKMSIDEALKLVISLGVIQPGEKNNNSKNGVQLLDLE
jgi:uncharacterized membrane protein